MKTSTEETATSTLAGYDQVLGDVAHVIEEARRAGARSVNAVMTATYWLVGRRIVEQDQGGRRRAGYGDALLERLAADVTARCVRGFSVDNLETMCLFFQTSPETGPEKSETPSRKLPRTGKSETPSRESELCAP